MTEKTKTRIMVRAGKNGPVIVERAGQLPDGDGNPVRVITERVVAVPNTSYYRRAITVGDLVVVDEKEKE